MKRTGTNKRCHEDCARFSKICNKLAAKILAAQATGRTFDVMRASRNTMSGKKILCVLSE